MSAVCKSFLKQMSSLVAPGLFDVEPSGAIMFSDISSPPSFQLNSFLVCSDFNRDFTEYVS